MSALHVRRGRGNTALCGDALLRHSKSGGRPTSPLTRKPNPRPPITPPLLLRPAVAGAAASAAAASAIEAALKPPPALLRTEGDHVRACSHREL